MNTNKPLVAFGGGTGMSCLLSGLKEYTGEITAIITVTDNGGSSGQLRKDFDMVPPGDIRNCLVALSDSDPLLEKLLQYRFSESHLKGHSFGNLFITAMTRVTGSFDVAVRELNRMLQVRGQVLPATGTKVSLIAHHPGGEKSTGEVQITSSGKPIDRVEMRPRVGAIEADVAKAIEEAELMVFGPGSLFTSIIPNLLVPGVVEGIVKNPCPKVYVANIMSQPGETTGMSLKDHVLALEKHAGVNFIDGLILNEGEVAPTLLEKYAQEGAYPIEGGAEDFADRDIKIICGELLHPHLTREQIDSHSAAVRHNSNRLAQLIAEGFLAD